MSGIDANPAIRKPWDDYEPEGAEVEAYLEQRDKIVAGLLAFESCPPRDLDVVGP